MATSSRTRNGLVQAELKDRPQVSDRQIAKALGVSHPTVATARKELEENGQVVKFTTSTGADGKAYPRQDERKPISSPVAKPEEAGRGGTWKGAA